MSIAPMALTSTASRLVASSSSKRCTRCITTSISNGSGPRPRIPPAPQQPNRQYSSTAPTQVSGARSGLVTALLVGIVGAGAYVAGSLYPPTLLSLVKPRDLPPSPDASSPEGIALTADIERQLQNLPMVKELLSRSVSGGLNNVVDGNGNPSGVNPATRVDTNSTSTNENAHYIACRPYRKFAPEKLLHSLTAGTLRGPGKFAVPPLVIAKTPAGVKAENDGHEGDAYAFIHLGRSLCGHNGIIHGGLLATICDEALARTAFFHLPSNVGVTARLELDYKAPTYADQFVVIKTELQEAKGRKAVVIGSILDMQGNVLVNARAVFVEPKFAKFLDASLVKDAMDRR